MRISRQDSVHTHALLLVGTARDSTAGGVGGSRFNALPFVLVPERSQSLEGRGLVCTAVQLPSDQDLARTRCYVS